MADPKVLKTRNGEIKLPAYIPVTTFGNKYPLDNLVRPYLPRLASAAMVSWHYAQQIREEVSWGIRNGVLPCPDLIKPLQITSLPLDPAADDFHERVNDITPSDLPDANRSKSAAENRPASQRSFWSPDQ